MRGNYTEVRAALPVSLSLQKSTVDTLRTLGDTPSGLYPGVTSGHEPPNCMESEALQGKHVALQGTKNSEEDSKREEELKPVEQVSTCPCPQALCKWARETGRQTKHLACPLLAQLWGLGAGLND